MSILRHVWRIEELFLFVFLNVTKFSFSVYILLFLHFKWSLVGRILYTVSFRFDDNLNVIFFSFTVWHELSIAQMLSFRFAFTTTANNDFKAKKKAFTAKQRTRIQLYNCINHCIRVVGFRKRRLRLQLIVCTSKPFCSYMDSVFVLLWLLVGAKPQ